MWCNGFTDAELLRLKKESSEKGGLSPNATAYAPPSQVSSEKTSSPSQQPSENALSSTKTHGAAESVISRAQPTSSTTSSTSDRGNAAVASSGPGLSPSSSIGSLSSERSTLNPHAKVTEVCALNMHVLVIEYFRLLSECNMVMNFG